MKILIMEFGSHETEVSSLCNDLLDMGHDVFVAAPLSLKETGLLSERVKFTEQLEKSSKPLISRVLGGLKTILKIKPDRIIFNTLQGQDVRWISRIIKTIHPQCLQSGIFHNAKKWENSRGTKSLLMRLNSVLVLNNTIKDYLMEKDFPRDRIFTYYANAFSKPLNPKLIHKLKYKKTYRIGIPGGIEFKRRNYLMLVDALKNTGTLSSKDISFDIIGCMKGHDAEIFHDIVIKEGLSDYFELHDYRPDFVEYFSRIEACDALLPLIDNHTEHNAEYLNSKVSGTLIMATTFRKPLIFCDGFDIKEYSHISDSVSFTHFDEILRKINKLTALSLNKKDFELKMPGVDKESRQSALIKALGLMPH